MRYLFNLAFICFFAFQLQASFVLIPMDAESQKEHLKAYGITYWVLERNQKVEWLLNYRGGSFLIPASEKLTKECEIRGVSYQVISDAKAKSILEGIESPSKNQSAVILEKAPNQF